MGLDRPAQLSGTKNPEHNVQPWIQNGLGLSAQQNKVFLNLGLDSREKITSNQ